MLPFQNYSSQLLLEIIPRDYSSRYHPRGKILEDLYTRIFLSEIFWPSRSPIRGIESSRPPIRGNLISRSKILEKTPRGNKFSRIRIHFEDLVSSRFLFEEFAPRGQHSSDLLTRGIQFDTRGRFSRFPSIILVRFIRVINAKFNGVKKKSKKIHAVLGTPDKSKI